MASARSVSRPCRRMVRPDLSRAVFYQYLFPFRFEKTASSKSRELSPPSPSIFARTRHLIQHSRGNVKCGKRSPPSRINPIRATGARRSYPRSRVKRRARLRHVLPVSHHPSAISGLAFWVKSSECPHISQQSIEIDRQIWGEHSTISFARSIWPSLQQRMKRLLFRWRQSEGA